MKQGKCKTVLIKKNPSPWSRIRERNKEIRSYKIFTLFAKFSTNLSFSREFFYGKLTTLLLWRVVTNVKVTSAEFRLERPKQSKMRNKDSNANSAFSKYFKLPQADIHHDIHQILPDDKYAGNNNPFPFHFQCVFTIRLPFLKFLELHQI